MTVTLQLDEKVVERAKALAQRRQVSVDAVFTEALEQMEKNTDPAAGFLALVDDLAAKGFSMPILTREERNARR